MQAIGTTCFKTQATLIVSLSIKLFIVANYTYNLRNRIHIRSALDAGLTGIPKCLNIYFFSLDMQNV